MPKASDSLDTHLLRVLCTLVAERSVSRTAIRLNQSQPAISNALKRLRDMFKDPLFALEKGRLIPTERALELHGTARSILGDIDKLFAEHKHFEPARSAQSFRVGSPDFLSVVFLSGVVERMRREAPHAHLIVHPLGPGFDYQRALAEGELDIVIGNWPTPPDNLHMTTLIEDDIVCVVGNTHSLAHTGISAEQYLRAAHIVPMPYSVVHRGVVETHLASLNLSRNAAVVLPYFSMAPYLLPGTDLVFTTSRHFARHFARFLPLAVLPPPLDFPRMRFYQLWHERTHLTDSHRWLRGLLGEVGRQVPNEEY
ncbi:LysR family transcriptional regulator [Thauera sp. Sel9]|uniref:LysR family transcriptional regulator n=1 Tax=Thauera sp. Sel9 TaxID=2974299 RepID=UPI0021E15E80|nr:LysR family transcriptional regulator [Thauera sp. Sel9]MCV2219731.1 LysR family transcriptional regulator [Thauera sp. Sel9]